MTDLDAAEIDLAVRAERTMGLNIAGVDLLRSKRGPLVLEVNSSPGSRASRARWASTSPGKSSNASSAVCAGGPLAGAERKIRFVPDPDLRRSSLTSSRKWNYDELRSAGAIIHNNRSGVIVKPIFRHLVLLASMQTCFLGVAVASDNVLAKPVVADTPEKFAETAAWVRKEMNAGGRYEFIRADDKTKVEGDLEAMTAMMQKSATVAAMPPEDKLRLFNTQEHLNGILTRSDSNRLVCERRAPVGSNIPVTSCKTVGEIEHLRHATQKDLQDFQQAGRKCAGKECSG